MINRILQATLLFSVILFCTVACCRQKTNPWTEKDCCYIDYYQSPPPKVNP